MDFNKIATEFAKNGHVQNVNFNDIHDNENVYVGSDGIDVRKEKVVSTKTAKKKSKKRDIKKEREKMTLKLGKGVIEAQLNLLYSELTKAEWIEGNEVDFKRLFSGRDDICEFVWTGKYGKGTLIHLFKEMVKARVISVPEGYNLPAILEGHFKDTEGERLSGLDKGDKPNKKALPFMEKCVTLLQADLEHILRSRSEDDYTSDEAEEEYDSYNNQDMILHNKRGF